MNGIDLDPQASAPIIEARLGRAPQDMLEAAVVLEAWAGVRPERALGTAEQLMAGVPEERAPSVGRLPRQPAQQHVLRDGLAFLVTVIAIACWASPLTNDLGVSDVRRALTIALPLTLALQWGLRGRFLDHPGGLVELARHRGALLLGPGATVLVGALLLGRPGTLAGLLTVTWVGGTILLRRDWPLTYVLIILLATAAMAAGLPALEVVRAAGVSTTLAVVLALRPSGRELRPLSPSNGRTRRALRSGLIGVGIGLMLVLDRSVSWTSGAVPALALLPSAVAGLWGVAHLRHLELSILRGLAGVPVGGKAVHGHAGPALRVLGIAIVRLIVLTAALSAALLLLTPWLGASARGTGVLAGFGLLALASLLLGLLDSLGGGTWVLVAVATATGAEAAIALAPTAPFPGVGLLVGGALAAILVVPAVVRLLTRSARTVATTLWIR